MGVLHPFCIYSQHLRYRTTKSPSNGWFNTYQRRTAVTNCILLKQQLGCLRTSSIKDVQAQSCRHLIKLWYGAMICPATECQQQKCTALEGEAAHFGSATHIWVHQQYISLHLSNTSHIQASICWLHSCEKSPNDYSSFAERKGSRENQYGVSQAVSIGICIKRQSFLILCIF